MHALDDSLHLHHNFQFTEAYTARHSDGSVRFSQRAMDFTVWRLLYLTPPVRASPLFFFLLLLSQAPLRLFFCFFISFLSTGLTRSNLLLSRKPASWFSVGAAHTAFSGLCEIPQSRLSIGPSASVSALSLQKIVIDLDDDNGFSWCFFVVLLLIHSLCVLLLSFSPSPSLQQQDEVCIHSYTAIHSSHFISLLSSHCSSASFLHFCFFLPFLLSLSSSFSSSSSSLGLLCSLSSDSSSSSFLSPSPYHHWHAINLERARGNGGRPAELPLSSLPSVLSLPSLPSSFPLVVPMRKGRETRRREEKRIEISPVASKERRRERMTKIKTEMREKVVFVSKANLVIGKRHFQRKPK